MNDILKAFKDAGLVDDDDERRIRHQQRVRKKDLGREGRKAERDAREARHRERDQEKKEQVRDAQRQHETTQGREERSRRTLARVETECLKSIAGRRRFHYRDRDGFLPAIAIDDGVCRRLEAGELALVESPQGAGQVRVVPRPVAQDLEQLRPELVLHLAGRKG